MIAISELLRRWFARKPEPPKRLKPWVETLEDRAVPAVWTVNDLTTLTPTALVQNLTGPGVTISNVSYTGANVAAGIFTDTSNSTGINSGVVLSSGAAKDVVGPNNSPSTTTSNGAASDPQLNALIAPTPGFDASVLQFNFVPTGDVVTFKYVFGSEEYPEFAPPNASSFNDVFAFYLNGVNVALVPGTASPVSINSVNAVTNTQFYVNNSTNPAGPIYGPYNTQMDGFTTVLSVTLAVNAGANEHIKLAIENAADQAYDSFVLIQAGSLASPQIKVTAPLRYTYHRATQTYTGNFTVVDNSGIGLQGPLYLIFPQLPQGVTLVNATGYTPTGAPYITLPKLNLKAHEVERVGVVFTNPLHVPLGTFFLHNPVELTGEL